MPTRIVKLEVVGLDPDFRAILFAVGDELRRGVNWWWRQWEAWHTARDSSALLAAEIEADRTWRAADKATRGERARPVVAPLPNELNRKLGVGVAKRCPGVNSRVLTLTFNKLGKTLRTKQSTAAACKWWRAILLDLDSRGCARRPQSIPLDGANAKIRGCDERGRVLLEFRADRIAKGERGTSTLISVQLKTDGKRAAYAQPARDMAEGTRSLKSATLIYDGARKKWFVALAYQADPIEAAHIDPERVAVLRPGRRRSCWRLRLPCGRTIALGGRGNHVRHVRRSLLAQRWGRQHAYTHAPARKGSGRERALTPLFKLTLRWNHFTRSCNDAVTAQLGTILSEHGCGKLVLFGGDDSRVLAAAGKIEGREDSTGWPWYQMQQLCEQKMSRLGVLVENRALFGGRMTRNAGGGRELSR